ncbi:MAG: enoyl-CoA hydratase-related protein [Bacteroidota bacterium]
MSDTTISLPRGNETVLLEQHGGVGLITLNRPERYNAMVPASSEALMEALVYCETAPSIRAVVLTGAGKGFCAGADMGEFAAEGITGTHVSAGIQTMYGPIVQRMMKMPKPIIAAINGSVAGVGISFALAADLRVMEPKSNIRFAFINIGLSTDGGCGWLLTRQVGYSRAFEIAIEGEKIYADRCYELGLCNKIAEEGTLLDKAMHWAHHLAARPTIAIGATKSVFNHALENSFASNMYHEAEQQAQCIESDDHKIGVLSFVAKQQPTFTGK